MRTSHTLIAIDHPDAADQQQVDEVLRTLVGLLETNNKQFGKQAAAGAQVNSTEEVLIDLDVDGYRYLLLRMPSIGRCRIRLSPREQEIVRMVAKGHPNKVIADVLNISSWTVCTHLRRIFAKLGVGSRAAMVAQLLEIGALTPDHRVSSELR
jgi:DNA-binding CsgD family transcriptional regulator